MYQLPTPQPARHPNPTVKATALAYLMFERPDLDEAEQFLTDFGLVVAHISDDTLYLRGTGPAPYCYRVKRAPKARFVGFGLCVESRAALEALARLPGASEVKSAAHPGGGECVVLTEPSGFTVEAIHGQAHADELPRRAPPTFNVGDAPLRINGTQRPPAIIKLGHVVLEVADFQATCAWYTQHFGFIPSDVQVLPDGSPAVAFMRLDLGDTPADHHTLAMAQGFLPTYSHSAYEVVDADAVGMGHRVLRENGWKHAPSRGGRAEAGSGERASRDSVEGRADEGARAASGWGRAAAPYFRAGRVRPPPLWRPAPGAGVPDGTRWGARHCGAPGTSYTSGWPGRPRDSVRLR